MFASMKADKKLPEAHKFESNELFKKFQHPDKTLVLNYLDLMYGWDSEFANIDNPSRKQELVIKKLGHQISEDGMEELIFEYLSYYQGNNKFQNLLMYRFIFFDLHRIAMEKITSTNIQERNDSVKLRKEIVDLCDSMEKKIEALMEEIYPEEYRERAAEVLKNIRTQESRLKELRKKETKIQ